MQQEQPLTSRIAGFGANNSTGFGAAKPAGFGAAASTAGGGLFGSTNTATAGSTGFGFGSNNTSTTSPFGGASTGGLFGQKPATTGFGATSTTPAFGASNTNTTTGGFGSGFGAGAGTALGANVGESPGTGSVAFAATVEKEPNSTTNQQNSFQSISFQQPYQKFSPEELRLTDYAQGRRYGQGASGATGAFGATNFGGFGSSTTASNTFGSNTNTGGGLFGGTNNTATSTPFGQNNNTTSAFGSGSTGGGLFGQNKPATGGLFGNSATTTQPAGGLFGQTNSTGGFGSTPAATGGFGTANTTSPFGANNTASKPGFSFGNNTASSTGGFGTANTTNGAFGSSTGGGLFGNNSNQPAQNTSTPFGGTGAQTGGGLFGNSGGFGQNNQQQQQQPAASGGLFGNAAAKPAGGLFGGTPANTSGTGLFGNTNNQASTSNPFGSTPSNTGGGLFGAAKPASAGGLFGNAGTNSTTNTGGGLFGGAFGATQQTQQQQPAASGGLFGASSAQQKPGGLFGNAQSSGSSLFGNTNQQQGGMFGNSGSGAPSNQSNSLFGATNNNLSNSLSLGQPQGLTASINDPSAFGTSMFSGMNSTQVQNPGPIATPLSSLSKQKKPGVLPMYKLNPSSSSSRFNTPTQKRSGFGFTHSTYGTPNSASSTSSTPLNLGGSMLGSSLGAGRLTKSMSTSSLRGSYSAFGQDSILAPGAFSASPSSRFNSTGSMKKLVINRGIRTDLFSPPPKDNNASASNSPTNNQQGILKKRVSFDTTTVGGANGKPATSPLKQVESSANPTAEELGYLRSSRSSNVNGSASSPGSSSQPEMEQVKGNELAIVHEEEASAPVAAQPKATGDQYADMEPGKYWMSPPKSEIQSMNRMQRQKVSNFVVGREGVGKVMFKVPVDLSNINLDKFYGVLVSFEVRSATIYPDKATKPPMGQGLNVPAQIELYNSYPRTSGRASTKAKRDAIIAKHMQRLARVPDTQIISYDDSTGTWVFTVEHFTTYGLEYDDETDVEGVSGFDQSTLSAPPDTPTPQSRTPKAYYPEDSFISSSEFVESDPEDTFDFKKKKVLPGAFDNQEAFIEEDAEMDGYDSQDQQSFLDDRSVGSQSDNGVDEPMDQDDVFQDRELVKIEDEITGAFPHRDDTAEPEDDYSMDYDKSIALETPGAVQRARLRAQKAIGTPSKRDIDLEDDNWMNMLQKTVSPRKQDREQLKRREEAIKDGVFYEDRQSRDSGLVKGRAVSDSRGFATSIDIMQSLFGQASKSPIKAAPKPQKGFEVGLPS